VLLSGGLDSMVLLALERRERGDVVPIHVRSGFAWEAAERRAIDRLLAHETMTGLSPLRAIDVDMRDVYPPAHWAVAGQPPAFDTPDEDVYLEGRNIVLLAKAAILCARLHIPRVALGLLANNPFPDATEDFLSSMTRALSVGLNHALEIATPLAQMHKQDVIRLGVELGTPLELSVSCMNPAPGDLHCGACSKCRERQHAFREAGVRDPTHYLARWTER
jgi:7-cyano-7-deazaguanine synthase